MKEAPRAAFSFTGFQIPAFNFNAEYAQDPQNMMVAFDPAGHYSMESGIFTLMMECRVTESSVADAQDEEKEQRADFVRCLLRATFFFSGKPTLAELPDYFYKNALAIVFPYLRAFVSTMTMQAGIPHILLPLINLSELEQPLRDSTIEDREEIGKQSS